MDALNTFIEELKGMRQDLKELCDALVPAEAMKTASLEQCKDLVDALAERVAELTGDASSLEDASCQLEREIAFNDIIDNPPLCAACNGSGEGQHDGTTCLICKGKGTVRND
jgi:hypothetical protein